MRFLKPCWHFLQSRKLALVLLLIVFTGMVFASLVPQQSKVDPQAYAAWQEAHPVISSLINLFFLDNIYQAWWFYLVVGLLLTNTLACTIGRLPPLLRQRKLWPRLEEDQIKGLKNWLSVETPLPCDPREAEVLYVEIEKLLRVLNQLMPSLGDRVQQPAAPLRNH